jgi:hypothetical protein
VQRIPLVKAALEMLDAQIMKLDDDFGKALGNGNVPSDGPAESAMSSMASVEDEEN